VESVKVGAPGPGQIRLRQTYIGVNFHDCYVRSGLYQTLPLPGVPGLEGVGVVETVGPGVESIHEGDHVAYFTPQYGSYATERLIDASAVTKIPDGIDDRTVAACWLRGLTAQVLAYSVFPIRAGQTVLVHAAAGGVGHILCQLAHHLGAVVIGTVGSAEKAEIARQAGCHHTILYREENFVERVHEITKGRGVDVVYDSVGKDTFLGSLNALGMRGHLCVVGQSSGPIEPFSISQLFAKSNSISRPGTFHYFTGEERHAMSSRLFEGLMSGTIRVNQVSEYAFAEAAKAHADLEARKTAGAVLLRV